MKLLRLSLGLGLLLFTISLVAFFSSYSTLPQTILLSTDPATGVATWGVKGDVALRILFGFVVLVVNTVIAYTFIGSRVRLAYLFAVFTFFYELLLCISVFGIVASN